MEPLAQWWERGVPCRDATAGGDCSVLTHASTECTTEVDPATGEPVKRCVKLYRRIIQCNGRPEKVDEQKEEVTARGEGAQQLEPNLVDLPSRLAAPAPAPAGPPGPPAPGVEDVGHAVQEFLRFAEELQEQLVPGTMHLDQVPAAAARPYSGEAEQQQQHQQQQQQHSAEEQPFSWLGGLLFGKRRTAQQDGGRRPMDASMWREFERDFTEV